MHGRLLILLICFTFFIPRMLSAEQLSVEAFSHLPEYTSIELSPDGTKLAFIENLQETELAVLTTYDMQTHERHFLVKSDNEKVKINWFEWANDNTLIVSVRYAGKRYGTDTTETRLLAIDDSAEGKPRALIKPRRGRLSKQHFSQFQDNVIDFLPDDPDHILVAIDLDVANLPSVYKLNIYSKKKSRIEKGKRRIRNWMTDQQHRLRIGMVTDYETGARKSLIRMPDGEEWQEYFAFNSLEEKPIYPVGFGLDPHIVYYKKYQGEMLALYKLDLASNEHTLVFEDPNHDVDGSLIYSGKTRDVIGITHSNSQTGRVLWDSDRAKLQEALDAALPHTDNYLAGFNRDENIYLLYTENDYTPGTYYLGNRKEGALSIIFGTYQGLNPALLSEHKAIQYKARDGIDISGYLTLPKSGKPPYPTIIHPHGGPGARDVDGFDYWTAFFAHRGYAVLRPNFRGSTGRGYSFSQRQMKAWGLEMQDDLEDGLTWLIEKGLADKNKVCIVGASYGGYAAMMGITKTPELYQCAVSFAGVSNLKLLVRDRRKYLGVKWVKQQIGEDSNDLENRSAYYQVDKIQSPILIIHGEDDRVVDVKQSQMMVDELDDQNKMHRYLELENGDHFLSIQRNRHAAFKAMDDFLSTYLKE